MRKILLLIVVLLLSLCGCATGEEKLPTFLITACNNEFLEDGVVVGTDSDVYTYNEDGLVIYSERYLDGALFSRTSYEYDEFGNPIKVITEGENTGELLEYKRTIDEGNRILREEVYKNGKLQSIVEVTYDQEGNELTREYTSYWLEETQWRKRTKTYDTKGNLICQIQHWNFNQEYYIWDYEDGLCVQRTSYETGTDRVLECWKKTYDRKGNLIRESQYDAAGNLKFYSEYSWDKTGRVQTKTNHNADGSLQKYSDVFTFDKYGNQIMQERYKDGKIYWRIRYIYEQLSMA